jgi:CRISPR-associated protein Cst2
MSAQQPIASLSISGRVTLNLHSLNNESGEGNQILTRQLTIVDKSGQEHTVNGISGDMFKHIHSGHLVNYAVEHDLPLSNHSYHLNPNKIGKEELEKFIKENKKPNSHAEHVIDAVINLCTVCDTHGLLITDKIGDNAKSSNTPRKSTAEFGWIVGVPEMNNSETYVHTKLVSDAGETETTGANEGQNIFHRPANHGVYAFVCNLDLYRIGFNDISRKYAISDEDREKRYKAILHSLLNSFLNPKGAMTSAQKPHITNFEGVISTSTSLTPAPTVSPLNDGYKAEIQSIQKNLNEIENNSIQTVDVYSLSQLSEELKNIMDSSLYKMKTKAATS